MSKQKSDLRKIQELANIAIDKTKSWEVRDKAGALAEKNAINLANTSQKTVANELNKLQAVARQQNEILETMSKSFDSQNLRVDTGIDNKKLALLHEQLAQELAKIQVITKAIGEKRSEYQQAMITFTSAQLDKTRSKEKKDKAGAAANKLQDKIGMLGLQLETSCDNVERLKDKILDHITDMKKEINTNISTMLEELKNYNKKFDKMLFLTPAEKAKRAATNEAILKLEKLATSSATTTRKLETVAKIVGDLDKRNQNAQGKAIFRGGANKLGELTTNYRKSLETMKTAAKKVENLDNIDPTSYQKK